MSAAFVTSTRDIKVPRAVFLRMSILVCHLNDVPRRACAQPFYVMFLPGCGMVQCTPVPLMARAHVSGSGVLAEDDQSTGRTSVESERFKNIKDRALQLIKRMRNKLGTFENSINDDTQNFNHTTTETEFEKFVKDLQEKWKKIIEWILVCASKFSENIQVLNSVNIENYVMYTKDLDEIYTEASYGEGPVTRSDQILNCDNLLRQLEILVKWVLSRNRDQNPPKIMLYGMYQTIDIRPVNEILERVCKKPNDEQKPFDKLLEYQHWGDILELYLQRFTQNESWCRKFNFQSDDPASYDEWFNKLDRTTTKLVLTRALHWAKGL
jgi:hypothetical protein